MSFMIPEVFLSLLTAFRIHLCHMFSFFLCKKKEVKAEFSLGQEL